jgi:hypothetical protein
MFADADLTTSKWVPGSFTTVTPEPTLDGSEHTPSLSRTATMTAYSAADHINRDSRTIDGISQRGYQYCIDLTRYIKQEQHMMDSSDISSHSSHSKHFTLENVTGRNVLILAGTSRVHTETISHLRVHYPCYNTPLLEELRAGTYVYSAVFQFIVFLCMC